MKKTSTKILAAILSCVLIVLSFALFSCGDNSDNSDNSGNNDNNVNTPADPDTGVSTGNKTDAELIALANEMVSGATGFTKVALVGKYNHLKSIFTEDSGKGYIVYTVVMNTRYGTVESEALIHVGTDGKIVSAKKLTWKTSDAGHGYVPPVQAEADAFYGRLAGASLADIADVEVVSNATSTSNNLINAIVEALVVIDDLNSSADLNTNMEALKGYAAELAGEKVSLVELPIEGEYTHLLRAWIDANGSGFYAYVTVISASYGTVESEALINIDLAGKIAGIKLLTWKTSDAIYGYVPPTQEEAEAFYARLVGADISTIDGVDVVANATNTSTNVKTSFKEALNFVNSFNDKSEFNTNRKILAIYAAGMAGKAVNLKQTSLPSDAQNLLALWYDQNGTGFYAYVTVISASYGTVESEALINIDLDGKIAGVRLLTWKTSDAIYGYVPPTMAEAEAFYARLVGADLTTIDTVELVSNATNTSTNVINSFKEALTYVKSITADPENGTNVIVLMNEAVKLTDTGCIDLEYIDIEGDYANLIFVLKDTYGSGYYAYVTVISASYGTVESEALIRIDDGKIAGIKLLTWKTSDAIYGYVPPTQEEADAFYARLVGADLTTIDTVELVSNATNTSTNVINSFKEALTFVGSLK